MALIQRNTAYSLNDIVNTRYGIKLKCTTAGTTDTDPLILDGTSPITDGTVVWEVQQEGGSGQGLVDYVPNTSYNVGDIVIYDDKIYRCITAHTSTSTFDITKWQKIGDEVFTGATNSQDGESGLVPQPTTLDVDEFLCGDGTWKTVGGIFTIVDTLWENTTSATIQVNDVLTLTHPVTDYDFILMNKVQSGNSTILVTPDRLDGIKTLIMASMPGSPNYCISLLASGTSCTVSYLNGAGNLDYIKGFKFINPNIYSTTEQEIGTWIDGKKLYQKTFSGTLSSSIDTTTRFTEQAYHDLSLYSISTVVELTGGITSSSDFTQFNSFQLSFSGSTARTDNRSLLFAYVSKDSSDSNKLKLFIDSGSWYAGLDYFATIKYTKV